MSYFVLFCWLFIWKRQWIIYLGLGRICLLLFTCNYVVSVGEVSSSYECLGWASLFYCDTPWAFLIIILYPCRYLLALTLFLFYKLILHSI